MKQDDDKTPLDKRYEEELGAYLHLQIEETEAPESEIVPEAARQKKFWPRLHRHRKILVSRSAEFFKDSRKMIFVWIAILTVVGLGIYREWDREIVGGGILVIGIVSSAFSWLAAGLLSAIALIPIIGPALVTVLSSSLLWVINGLGYFVSIIAIRAGHGKTVLSYRLLVIVFLTGLAVGYVIARLIH